MTALHWLCIPTGAAAAVAAAVAVAAMYRDEKLGPRLLINK